MSTTETLCSPDVVSLRDFYDPTDFTLDEVYTELSRVYRQTAIEREWFATLDIEPFAVDEEINNAVNTAKLGLIVPTTGVTPIWRLRNGESGNYSPPYLRHRAAHVLNYIGLQWAVEEGESDGKTWSLPITSLTRSTKYQTQISQPSNPDGTELHRKIAINPANDEHSSHEYGYAFDIDARGLYYESSDGFIAVNSTTTNFDAQKIEQSRDLLRTILTDLQEKGFVNVCEELQDTHQWCFHVCVNPTLPAPKILFGLRLDSRA